MEGFASATAARRGRKTATRQRQRRAGICRSRQPNFSYSFLFSCHRFHVGTKRSCRSYFSFPRGYDMTSNKTYSYPYSTHKRYLFSVCRKPLLDSARTVDYTALRLARRSAIPSISLDLMKAQQVSVGKSRSDTENTHKGQSQSNTED
jgi:hypothetical protein